MISLRLPPDIDMRLDDLAKRTGRTKRYHVRQAILEYLDVVADAAVAEERLRDVGETVTWEEVKARLDLS